MNNMFPCFYNKKNKIKPTNDICSLCYFYGICSKCKLTNNNFIQIKGYQSTNNLGTTFN